MLEPTQLAALARVALGHVQREYPHIAPMRLASAADLQPPSRLHPVFYGSYDWHSCVHSYWLLARIRHLAPALPEAQAINDLFDQQLTSAKLEQERTFFLQPGKRNFERPYGWAWLLKLQAELAGANTRWAEALQPLATELAQGMTEYLPRLSAPIRSGAHNNTAFALLLAMDYAEACADHALAAQIHTSACDFYLHDRSCQAWEPGGEDFLSPALQEAALMQRLLSVKEFDSWFSGFLPRLAEGEPATLLTPAHSRDRSDGKLAHLDGLNLSRAWCLRALAKDQPLALRQRLLSAAQAHLQVSLPHIQGDYMGEHWLATFALLALQERA
ncbi:MAG: DUF2891 domain-containing protein [Halopseudomonas sp.]|uniref:DUF2891 domain-containing protein n=1 Tax=Halopseudomonas sp. TaxID=2901191 RepID=UPI0030022CCF